MSALSRKDRIEAMAARYPHRRSVLLPALWLVMREDGWISEDAMREVAVLVGVTPAEVFEVVSFYTQFQRRPVGRHLIGVCDTLTCALCGAYQVGRYLQEKLEVKVGETTADGRFTLLYFECLGACTLAPAMLVDEDLHGNLTPERIDAILEQYP